VRAEKPAQVQRKSVPRAAASPNDPCPYLATDCSSD
jgi:hypothetical protein